MSIGRLPTVAHGAAPRRRGARAPAMLGASIALLALPACLETEEDIVVHPDGALTVTITAKGDGWDFLDGYPLPTGAPFEPLDAEAARWMAGMASGDVDAWRPPVIPGVNGTDDDDGIALSVAANVTSADALPERFAPGSEPYPEAFQRRATALSIEPRGGRVVYTFTRTYHRHDALFRHADAWAEDRLDELPEPVKSKFDDDEPLAAAEWELVGDALRDCFAMGGELVAREALAALYTEGDATLAPASAARIAAAAGAAAGAEVRADELLQHQQALAAGAVGADDPDPIDVADRRAREALRRILVDELTAEGVERGVVNAVVGRAELLLAAWDQATDLRDEEFTTRVTMPGRIVGGNFHERDGSTARWDFKGEWLQHGEVVLRVVSVVE